MAIIGALDKTKHFDEFNDPLFSNEGVKSPATRKAEALANLGAASTAALAGITGFTDNTGGAVSDTLAGAAGANPTAAEFENAVASLAAKIEEILAALT